MKDLLLVLLILLVYMPINAQVRNDRVPTSNEERATVRSPFAYLLISTDLDVEVSVNFKEIHQILASVGGKEIPVYGESNIVKVIPMDGGEDGYNETVSIERGKTVILEIKLNYQRQEEERSLARQNNISQSLEQEKKEQFGSLKQKAGLFYEAGEYDRALSAYEEILNLFPSEESITQKISSCLQNIRREKEAGLAVERAVEQTRQRQEEQKRRVANCPLCLGSGVRTNKIECNTCSGAGKTITNSRCSVCDGTSRIYKPCPKCNNAGKYSCHKCQGKGEYPNPSFNSRIPENKPWEVGGNHRNLKCGLCSGSGEEKCSQCNGYPHRKFWDSCNNCTSGYVGQNRTCWNCSGSGAIEERTGCSHDY